MLTGPDVSSYQGSVDWGAVARAGHRVGIAKATEGATYRDPWFNRARWEAMAKAGLVRGAYHFARPQPGRSPEAEADHFVDAVVHAGGWRDTDLPPILDIEWTRLSPPATWRWASRFCKRVKHRTGRSCWTYTGEWFWGGLPAPEEGREGWISGYPNLIVPRGFRGHVVGHQFTDRAHVSGVSGGCDLSRFFIDPPPRRRRLPRIPSKNRKPPKRRTCPCCHRPL